MAPGLVLAVVLVVLVGVLAEAAQVDGVPALSSQCRVGPHDHLAFRDGHHRDQQKDPVDVTPDAVSAAGFRTGASKADATAGVNLGLGHCLELLVVLVVVVVVDGCSCHLVPSRRCSGPRSGVIALWGGLCGETHICIKPQCNCLCKGTACRTDCCCPATQSDLDSQPRRCTA